MRNGADSLSLFTVAPVRTRAPGWKITGNCWSHWIQFGCGWKTKITKLWLLKRQGQRAQRPCCYELIWYIFLPLEMSEVLARDGQKKKKIVRGRVRPPLSLQILSICHITFNQHGKLRERPCTILCEGCQTQCRSSVPTAQTQENKATQIQRNTKEFWLCVMSSGKMGHVAETELLIIQGCFLKKSSNCAVWWALEENKELSTGFFFFP